MSRASSLLDVEHALLPIRNAVDSMGDMLSYSTEQVDHKLTR